MKETETEKREREREREREVGIRAKESKVTLRLRCLWPKALVLKVNVLKERLGIVKWTALERRKNQVSVRVEKV